MGKRHKKNGRHIHGILLLDKPTGITSNTALQRVKRLYDACKAGHTGSLDKMASGLLPICLGEATKLSSYLLNSDKHYRATCKLGIVTSTGDAAGEKVSVHKVPSLTREDIEEVLNEFRGEIAQVPPMYSALKYKGQRLYQLAYQGIEVEREARSVMIDELSLLDYAEDQIEINVRCSKGTYIRTLAEDVGNKLGCGAHISALRRLGVGPFNEDQMISAGELEQSAEQGLAVLDQQLLPMDSALLHLSEVELAENVAYYIRMGQPVLVPRAPTAGLVRIYDQNRVFLGIGEVLEDGRIAPRRLMQMAP